MSHNILVRNVPTELKKQLDTAPHLQHFSSLSEKVNYILSQHFDKSVHDFAHTEAQTSEKILAEVLERNTTILEKILAEMERGS